MSSEEGPAQPRPSPKTPARPGAWDRYWDRFRRQQVDDPVERRREGLWERFERQQVDDPVDERRSPGTRGR
jgi:hypothetical protein